MSCIVFYFCTWAVLLFIVLPIGIKQDNAPIVGNDIGAPLNPNMTQKFIIVSVITTILLGIYITTMLFRTGSV
jgi:predicted secreted protein